MGVDDTTGAGLGIAVIGMSCAFPGASGTEEFWRNIVSGTESLTDLTEAELLAAGEDPGIIASTEYIRRAAHIDDIEMFDAAFFGFTPREAERMDPQHRLFFEHCWHAIEAAGYDVRRMPGPVGVYAGQGVNTYLDLVRSQVDREEVQRSGGRWENVGALENDVDYLTPKISYVLNLTGPSIPVSTACSTSLVAVHLACQALRTFECDAALAGGISITPPVRRGYLYQEGGIASADGHTRAFDSRSTGTVFGSGVGVVLLKRLEDALADGDTVDGVIIGSAVNNDGGARAGFTAPGIDGQADLVAAAQALADAHPDTITCLEAHGTGTPIGDPIEVAALTRAFRERTDRREYCALGSVKANIGHMDSAAGIAGLIKALHAVKHAVIPPQINFQQPNEALRLSETPFRIATEREDWHTPAGVPRRAGVSSFGIGGTNAHVIVEQPPAVERVEETAGRRVLAVSARDDRAVGEALTRLADHLQDRPVRLDDTAYTLHAGRARFPRRAAVVARDRAEAVAALRERCARPYVEARPGAAVAFLFPGQGAQYPGMARGLYGRLPEFTDAFDRAADAFTPLIGHDLKDLVLGDGAGGGLDRARFVQPALFAVEYAMARAVIARGVRPAAMLGHSMGEFVAATVSGVFPLDVAARVVDTRARLMREAPRGGMLAVPLPAAEAAAMLPDGLVVAADNGPRLVSVSGAPDALAAFERTLSERGLTTRRLRVEHALHSPAMDDAAGRFVAFMRDVPVGAPTLPYISNVTGDWITEEQVRDPGYWGAQMRGTVRFREGLDTLLTRVDGPLVEVGPGHGTLSLARAAAAEAPESRFVRTARSAADDDDDLAVVHAAFAALWEQGVELDWAAFDRGGERRTGLPGYPFQRRRFWIDAEPAGGRGAVRPAPRGTRDPRSWLYAPAWRSLVTPRRTGREPLDVVVAGEPGPLTAAFTNAARTAGHRVGGVTAASPDELFRDLGTALSGAGRATVVYTAGDAAATAPARLLAVVRALAARSGSHVDLLVVTAGAFDVTGDEPINPDHAILAGIGKVIPKELPHVSCRLVDLDPARDAAATAATLVEELDVSSPDPVVAHRGARRWAQGVERLPATAPETAAVPLRDKGVYLITGGLGGIGLSLAGFLARSHGAGLVLAGRTGVPEPADWDAWLSGHDEHDPTSARITRLRAIEADGGEVVAVRADVTDAEAVRALVRTAVDRYGRLDGVVHAAGLAGDSELMETLGSEAFERTIAPKVAGARAVLRATAGAGLDFVALFSSLTTVDSWDGAADYTAGNAFLDALAHQARRLGRPEVLAIDWTGWLDLGMNAVPGESPDDPGAFLTEAEGHEVFRAALATGLAQVHVSVADLHAVVEQARRFARDGATRPAGAAGHAPAGPVTGSRDAHGGERPAAAGDFVAPRTPVETRLCEVFQSVLGFDRIGCSDNFFALGGNSLLALDLIGQVRRTYAVPILLRDFFSRPTVSGLAGLVTADEGPADATAEWEIAR